MNDPYDDLSPEANELFSQFCEQRIKHWNGKTGTTVLFITELTKRYYVCEVKKIVPLLDELVRRRVINSYLDVMTMLVPRTGSTEYRCQQVRLKLAPRGKELFGHYVALESL